MEPDAYLSYDNGIMALSFIKPFTASFLSPAPDTPAERQVGVIPYARVANETTFLLITSRGTGKWIFPKGNLPADADPREIAIREAREEAGVAGPLAETPLGTYRDWKTRDGVKVGIEVALFPMLVAEQFDDWIESAQRYRHWVTFPEFRALVNHDDIVALAAKLNASLTAA